ncbi:hypothetical protein [Nostoc sp.]|uniref:hypothetical protein n=1 Tax=Nostoc sp. TaxID=1180 RepID=UPI002FF870C5
MNSKLPPFCSNVEPLNSELPPFCSNVELLRLKLEGLRLDDGGWKAIASSAQTCQQYYNSP